MPFKPLSWSLNTVIFKGVQSVKREAFHFCSTVHENHTDTVILSVFLCMAARAHMMPTLKTSSTCSWEYRRSWHWAWIISEKTGNILQRECWSLLSSSVALSALLQLHLLRTNKADTRSLFSARYHKLCDSDIVISASTLCGNDCTNVPSFTTTNHMYQTNKQFKRYKTSKHPLGG